MSGERPADRRRRLLAVVAVGLLPWLVAPGLVQPDTKTDLTLTPWRYLGRALSAWNEHAGGGELQNQAYGYLFPMGPVLGGATSAGLPAWAAQRLWWSLLLVVAFVGAERLLRRTGAAGPTAALAGAACYALAPRVLTVLAPISVEAWPGALAPWLVLAALPLVGASAGGRARVHAAAATGLLTAALGGVNAVASAAVLLLPLVLLLTAPGWGRRRVRALLLWSGGVLLGAAWWVLPLLVLGRYAYPFLDLIETSRITTAVTGVPHVLRGAPHWIAYLLDGQGHPVWQGGWVQAQEPVAVLSGCVLAAAGLAGLLLLRTERQQAGLARWAVVCVTVGTVLMGLGYAGRSGSPLAGPVRDLLDGPLAPLRNVHKLDPLVRLPVALGAAHVLSRLSRRRAPGARAAALVTAAAAVLAPTALWAGRVGDPGAYRALPAAWPATAARLDLLAARGGGTTLVLPAARTARYRWGSTTDEPLAALAASPVVTRAAAPLGHPGATRLLDRLDRLAATGTRQDALAPALARAGIARVVVRHDLDPAAGALPASRVEATLARSPGLRRLTGDGPLSLWQVTLPVTGVVVHDAADALPVAGGPEATVDLARAGLLDPLRAVLPGLAATGAAPARPRVVIDTAWWRTLDSGLPAHAATGPLLPASDPGPRLPGLRDLPSAGDPRGRPVLRTPGLRALRASGSAADPRSEQPRGPATAPAAALDDDLQTGWVDAGEGDPWLELDLARPTRLPGLVVHLAAGDGLVVPDRVQVEADPGTPRARRVSAPVRDGRARLSLPGAVTRLVVRLPGVPAGQQAGIAEITWPGRDAGAVVHLPAPVGAGDALLLGADPAAASAAGLRGRVDAPALTRSVVLAAGRDQAPAVRLRPRWGAALEQVLDGGLEVSGSRSGADPATRPGAALDGDPRTRWRLPAGTDLAALTLRLPAGAGVRAVRVAPDPRVRSVRVRRGPADPVRLLPGTGGAVGELTGRLQLELVLRPQALAWPAPEITLEGLPRTPVARVDLPCGRAGVVEAGDRRVPLAAQVTAASLAAGESITARPCGRLVLATGTQVLSVRPSAVLTPESLLLPGAGAPARPLRPSRVVTQATGRRTVQVGAGRAGLLTLDQARNDGWRATGPDGRALRPVTVDGWRQGFVVPAGGPVRVTAVFVPARAHRAGLLAGAAGVVLLAGGWWATRGRPGTGRGGSPVPEPPAGRPEEHGRRSRAWGPGRRAGRAGVPALVGLLVAGPAGAALGAATALVPRRRLPAVAAGAMAAAGAALVTFGVTGRQDAGGAVAQLLGVTALACLTAPLPSGGAPPSGRAAPPAGWRPSPPPR